MITVKIKNAVPIFFCLFFLLSAVYQHSRPIEDLFQLSVEAGDILLKTGEYSRFTNTSQSPLLKNHPFSGELAFSGSKEKPASRLEILFLWKPWSLPQTSGPAELYLFNTLLKISRLSGIEYYSSSAKKTRVLFETVQALDPVTQSPLQDPSFSSVKDHYSINALINDTRFGTFTARIDYKIYEDCLTLSLSNISPLYLFGTFQIVSPSNLFIQIAVFPDPEGFLFYGCSAINLTTGAAFRKNTEESLYYRLKALEEWFRMQIGYT